MTKRLRFGVRTLMIAMAVIAVGLTYWRQAAVHRDRALRLSRLAAERRLQRFHAPSATRPPNLDGLQGAETRFIPANTTGTLAGWEQQAVRQLTAGTEDEWLKLGWNGTVRYAQKTSPQKSCGKCHAATPGPNLGVVTVEIPALTR